MKRTSPGEKSSSTEDKTSSDSEAVSRAVMRPTPFAADHLTIVSYKNKLKIQQGLILPKMSSSVIKREKMKSQELNQVKKRILQLSVRSGYLFLEIS